MLWLWLYFQGLLNIINLYLLLTCGVNCIVIAYIHIHNQYFLSDSAVNIPFPIMQYTPT